MWLTVWLRTQSRDEDKFTSNNLQLTAVLPSTSGVDMGGVAHKEHWGIKHKWSCGVWEQWRSDFHVLVHLRPRGQRSKKKSKTMITDKVSLKTKTAEFFCTVYQKFYHFPILACGEKVSNQVKFAIYFISQEFSEHGEEWLANFVPNLFT